MPIPIARQMIVTGPKREVTEVMETVRGNLSNDGLPAPQRLESLLELGFVEHESVSMNKEVSEGKVLPKLISDLLRYDPL